MRRRAAWSRELGDRIQDRIERRVGPIAASVVLVGLGLAYIFRWGSVVRHVPSLWIAPGDLADMYRASSALAHGHFSAIYQGHAVLTFPGMLVLLAPFGALSGHLDTVFVTLIKNHHVVTNTQFLLSRSGQIWDTGTIASGAHRANVYAVQPQWVAIVFPFAIVVSCAALFALDALAERLGVSPWRRAVLVVAQGVVLWPVVTIWGHPEDALSVALVVYALISALDGHFARSGWLFGASLALQPLVIVVLPALLVLGGRRRIVGLLVRGVVPAAAVTAAPLVADFHATVHNLVTQPAYPDISVTHQTPWTFLAPKLGGRGSSTIVGGGPVRASTLVLAAGLGWLVQRWRTRPEMIVWTVALALALRTYTESVMTAYYVWPALAVGLVAAARGVRIRFAAAVVAALGTTVLVQQSLSLFVWWTLTVLGVTAVLVASAWPVPVAAPDVTTRPRQVRGAVTRARPTGQRKKSSKATGSGRRSAGVR